MATHINMGTNVLFSCLCGELPGRGRCSPARKPTNSVLFSRSYLAHGECASGFKNVQPVPSFIDCVGNDREFDAERVVVKPSDRFAGCDVDGTVVNGFRGAGVLL